MLLAADLSWALDHFDFNLLIDDDILTLQRPLNQHDVFKIEKILDDLGSYLTQLKGTLLLNQLEKDDIQYFSDGRDTVIKILEIEKLIDKFISAILSVPLVLNDSALKAKLKCVSQVLLDCKQALLTTRKKVEIVSKYHEIKDLIIGALSKEVKLCAKSFELSKLSLLPLELPKDISLAQITTKMRLNDISHTTGFSMRSMALPMFTNQEKETYSQFEAIERRFDPIHFSMDFVDQTVKGFNSMCGSIFPGTIIELNREYDRLRKQWENLLMEFISLKKHTVDIRWHNVFLFLIEDVLQKIPDMISELHKDYSNGNFQISNQLAVLFKTCSNVIKLIHKGFTESVIYDKELTKMYNETLLPKWQDLNMLLAKDFPTVKQHNLAANELLENEYRPIRMIQRCTSLDESSHEKNKVPVLGKTPSLGLDLGLDVDISPSVPLSIEKKDRIVDLSIDIDIIPKNDVQKALMEQFEAHYTHEDDDVATLVHDTPVITPKPISDSSWKLPRRPSLRTSRIPVISSNYIQMGFPVIKKVRCGTSPSRIPTISLLNVVFISPERRPDVNVLSELCLQKQNLPIQTPKTNSNSAFRKTSMHILDSPFSGLRSPPQFLLSRGYKNGKRRVSSSDGSVSGDDIFRSGRSRSSSLRLRSDQMSLAGMKTPNLGYGKRQLSDYSPDRLSLHSTSPERPESSIGSRFDDIHLMRPLKSPKRAWK